MNLTYCAITAMSIFIKILVIEDNPEYREVLELIIQETENFHLSNSFGTAERALRHMSDKPAESNLDIILLDLNLPGIGGIEAIPYFEKLCPKAKIIILTQSDSESDILYSIKKGASGYLLKSATAEEITSAIQTVHQGGSLLDSHLSGIIMNAIQTQMPSPREKPNPLTTREQEVLKLLAQGLAKKEIASVLSISVTTVVTHVSHIYDKFNVPNAPSAITKAFEMGILSVKEPD